MSNQKAYIDRANTRIYEWLGGKKILEGFLPSHIRRIANGRMYDTEKSERLAGFSHDPREPWYALEENLYQTKSGNFFLTAEGLGGSPYGYTQEWANERVRGHVLLPLTGEQVKEWLELRELLDEYIDIFGCPDWANQGPQLNSFIFVVKHLSAKLGNE